MSVAILGMTGLGYGHLYQQHPSSIMTNLSDHLRWLQTFLNASVQKKHFRKVNSFTGQLSRPHRACLQSVIPGEKTSTSARIVKISPDIPVKSLSVNSSGGLTKMTDREWNPFWRIPLKTRPAATMLSSKG